MSKQLTFCLIIKFECMKIIDELLKQKDCPLDDIFKMIYGGSFWVCGLNVLRSSELKDFSIFSEDARKEWIKYLLINNAELLSNYVSEVLEQLTEGFQSDDVFDLATRKRLINEFLLWKRWGYTEQERLNKACFLLIYFKKYPSMGDFVEIAKDYDLKLRNSVVIALLAHPQTKEFLDLYIDTLCALMKIYFSERSKKSSKACNNEAIQKGATAIFAEFALWQKWGVDFSACNKSLKELLTYIIKREEVTFFAEMLKQSGFVIPKTIAEELTTFVEKTTFKEKGAKLQLLQILNKYM